MSASQPSSASVAAFQFPCLCSHSPPVVVSHSPPSPAHTFFIYPHSNEPRCRHPSPSLRGSIAYVTPFPSPWSAGSSRAAFYPSSPLFAFCPPNAPHRTITIAILYFVQTKGAITSHACSFLDLLPSFTRLPPLYLSKCYSLLRLCALDSISSTILV